MGDPLSDDRRAEIGRQLERGLEEVSAICEHGRDRWRMSIPAQPDRDSDLILSAALAAGREALAEVERLRTANERYLNRIDVLAGKHRRAVAREGVLRQQRDQAAAQLERLRRDLGQALDRSKEDDRG